MLSREQIAHFRTFGFLIIRQAFTGEKVEALVREADGAYAEKTAREADAAYAEKTDREADAAAAEMTDGGNDGATFMWASGLVEERPALTELVEDDRIYLAIRELLGGDCIWIGSEVMWGIDPKLADHTWHFDGHKSARHLDYPRTKVMLYLDPQRRDTGALRVIPGSHRDPLHETLFPLQDAHLGGDPSPYGVEGPQVPACAVETDPGDVVFFNQWLYHAVYGKEGKRRVIIFKFGPRPRTEAHLAMLRENAPSIFTPHPSFRDSERPRIRNLVEGLADLA